MSNKMTTEKKMSLRLMIMSALVLILAAWLFLIYTRAITIPSASDVTSIIQIDMMTAQSDMQEIYNNASKMVLSDGFDSEEAELSKYFSTHAIKHIEKYYENGDRDFIDTYFSQGYTWTIYNYNDNEAIEKAYLENDESALIYFVRENGVWKIDWFED